MNEQEAQGWGPVWGAVRGVEVSASRLRGLAMGHDPSRTALPWACSSAVRSWADSPDLTEATRAGGEGVC